MLKWTVEFEVDETWVADGFNLTDERAKQMIENDLAYAYGFETKAKVIKSPSLAKIMKLQGYSEESISSLTTKATRALTDSCSPAWALYESLLQPQEKIFKEVNQGSS